MFPAVSVSVLLYLFSRLLTLYKTLIGYSTVHNVPRFSWSLQWKWAGHMSFSTHTHTRTHKHVHLAASHCSVKPLLIVKQELDNGLQSWPVYQTPYTFCSPVRTTINSPQLDFTPPPLWHLGWQSSSITQNSNKEQGMEGRGETLNVNRKGRD